MAPVRECPVSRSLGRAACAPSSGVCRRRYEFPVTGIVIDRGRNVGRKTPNGWSPTARGRWRRLHSQRFGLSAMSATLKIRPMTGWTGAEVEGVDLSSPLAGDVVEEIRQAWLKWKVLVFRGQCIDDAGQVAFTTRFGPLTDP